MKVEPMSKGSESAPLLMASLFSAKALIEYGANFVSDFDFVYSCVCEGSFYYCFGVHDLHIVKNLTPLRVFTVRKRVWAFEGKFATLCSTMKAHL
jgi:heme/copper-type cytochrome/quinol oxidase subunit 3